MAHIAVFASGRGTNFIALHNYFLNNPSQIDIACLVSDVPDCGALTYAKSKGIPSIVLDYSSHKRGQVEAYLKQELARYSPDLLVLAGFMRIIGKTLLEAWPHKIINIHPSLLPRHAGSHGIRDSYDSGDRFVGISIHYVDAGIDTGPIILQKSFERDKNDSLVQLEEKIHLLEHEWYPKIVHHILDPQNQTLRGTT